jgi:hypothetical protein
MKLNTPLVTLLSGAALGVGVLVTSILWTSGTSSAASGSGATLPASATAAATPAPASPASAATPATAPATTPATAPTIGPATTPATTPGTAPAAAPTGTASAYQAGVPAQADYVGQVDGGGAAVAISVHSGKAVAYICNGHAVAAWLRGTAQGGKLDLTGKNGAQLSVNYRTGMAAGSIMADGTRYNFSAPLVRGVPSGQRPPGLYEATATVDGVKVKAGWIVLQNGSQVGSVEYLLGSAVLPTAQAPVLDLTTGTAQYDGVTLVAHLISGITGSGF